MRFEHILIAMAVFFTVIAIGASLYVGSDNTKGLMEEYGVTPDSELFSNLTQEDYPEYYDDSDSALQTLKSDTLEGDTEISTEATESSIYKKALQQIGQMGNIITMPFKLISRIGEKTGGLIPSFITDFFIKFIMILGIAFIIYMFIRYKPQEN